MARSIAKAMNYNKFQPSVNPSVKEKLLKQRQPVDSIMLYLDT